MIYDCLPIGRVQRPIHLDPNDPNSPVVEVVNMPAFGTMHWCMLEPVRKMRHVIPRWHYWVDEESQESQDNFHAAWKDFFEQLEVQKEIQRQMNSNLAVASVGDLKRMEESAKKMGIAPGPDLVKAMKHGNKR